MTEGTETTPRRLEIRKYPNRRYYDSTRSCHVTLEEIHQLIRDGYEVQITDSKTEQDITAKILGQIIIELDTPKMGVFPVPLLHRILRSNEQLVSDFVQKYNQALMAFLDSQRSVEQYLRNAMGMHAPSPLVADWAKLMWSSFNPSLWSAQDAPRGPGQPAPETPPAAAPANAAPGNGAPQPQPQPQDQPKPSAPDEPDLRRVIDDLRQQVSNLQGQLSKNKKKSHGRI